MTRDDLVDILNQDRPELRGSLENIQRFVTRWWTTNYMPWFTDHGPAHSSRVASYALRLIPDLLQPGTELTSLELYVLTAAAWLHDLGMQRLGGPAGGLVSTDYVEVRKRHPAESLGVIVEKSSEIGLPENDPQIVTAVALVAQAHGTEYFQQTLSKLQGMTVRNERCRCDLLAALLLFADELDLHYERARFPDSLQTSLPPISRAHNFKHHYVTAVGLTRDERGKTSVSVDFDFPATLGEDARELIQRWIDVKLQQQMGLISRTLDRGLGGQLRLSRLVRLCPHVEAVPTHRVLDQEGLAIIREEVARAQIIDLRQALNALAASLTTHRVIGVLGSPGHEDLDGREDVLGWLQVRASLDSTVVVSQRLRLNQGGAASDVLEEWIKGLGHIAPASLPDEASRRVTLVNELRIALASVSEGAVVSVSSFDLLPTRAQSWMVRQCFPVLLAELPTLKILYTSSADRDMNVLPDHWALRLGSPDPSEVVEHFRRFSDEEFGEVYGRTARCYGDLRARSAEHELLLKCSS